MERTTVTKEGNNLNTQWGQNVKLGQCLSPDRTVNHMNLNKLCFNIKKSKLITMQSITSKMQTCKIQIKIKRKIIEKKRNVN